MRHDIFQRIYPVLSEDNYVCTSIKSGILYSNVHNGKNVRTCRYLVGMLSRSTKGSRSPGRDILTKAAWYLLKEIEEVKHYRTSKFRM